MDRYARRDASRRVSRVGDVGSVGAQPSCEAACLVVVILRDADGGISMPRLNQQLASSLQPGRSVPACSPSTPLRPVVPPYIFSHTFNYIMTTAFPSRMAFTNQDARTARPRRFSSQASGMIVVWERESAKEPGGHLQRLQLRGRGVRARPRVIPPGGRRVCAASPWSWTTMVLGGWCRAWSEGRVAPPHTGVTAHACACIGVYSISKPIMRSLPGRRLLSFSTPNIAASVCDKVLVICKLVDKSTGRISDYSCLGMAGAVPAPGAK